MQDQRYATSGAARRLAANALSPDLGEGDELVLLRRQHSRHHVSKKSEG